MIEFSDSSKEIMDWFGRLRSRILEDLTESEEIHKARTVEAMVTGEVEKGFEYAVRADEVGTIKEEIRMLLKHQDPPVPEMDEDYRKGL